MSGGYRPHAEAIMALRPSDRHAAYSEALAASLSHAGDARGMALALDYNAHLTTACRETSEAGDKKPPWWSAS